MPDEPESAPITAPASSSRQPAGAVNQNQSESQSQGASQPAQSTSPVQHLPVRNPQSVILTDLPQRNLQTITRAPQKGNMEKRDK
jgi:hypothetical protein